MSNTYDNILDILDINLWRPSIKLIVYPWHTISHRQLDYFDTDSFFIAEILRIGNENIPYRTAHSLSTTDAFYLS
jgi:hypothetical protein